jgi:hypothetical protein
MAVFTEIRVDEVILHILDPPDRTSDPEKPARRGLVLSQRSLPPQTDSRVFQYFQKRIEGSLASTQVRAARFTDPASPVATTCKALLKRGGDLVAGSQVLAQRLYTILQSKGRISRGDLAVCRYSAREDGQPVNQVALLKLDPTEAFRQTTEKDSQGRSYVAVEIETEVLPTGDLQKCAFLREPGPPPEDFAMILLDRQLPTEAVARFFSRDFLGAELAIDSRQAAKKFSDILTDTENRLRPKLTPAQLSAFQQEVRTVLSQPVVPLKRWIKTLPQEIAADVNTGVSAAQLPDPLQLNQVYLAKATSKVKYRGDFDLTLEVPADRFDQLITVTPRKPRVGPSFYEIVIRTQKWDKVK